MPRIAVLCTSSGFGGLEMNTLKLCLWLKQMGWEVGMMVQEGTETHRRAGDYCEAVVLTSKGRRGEALRKWMRSFKADILFTPYNKDIAPAASYKRFRNRSVKLVYQQHMMVGIKKRDPVHSFRYAMIDLWIAPLNYLREEALQLTRVPLEKIAVIPFGLEPERFLHSELTQLAARERLQLPANARIIGVLGRIDPQKGQDFLIRSLRPLEEKHGRTCHLLIMGSVTPNEGDAYREQLIALADGLGLKDRVHFREFMPDPAVFYKAIDMFALPSHGETFGMVTLEAMLNGLPVIGTDKDGTREILKYGALGALYDRDSIEDFCMQLDHMESNPALAEQLEAARNEVLERYTKDRMMERLDAALRALL